MSERMITSQQAEDLIGGEQKLRSIREAAAVHKSTNLGRVAVGVHLHVRRGGKNNRVTGYYLVGTKQKMVEVLSGLKSIAAATASPAVELATEPAAAPAGNEAAPITQEAVVDGGPAPDNTSEDETDTTRTEESVREDDRDQADLLGDVLGEPATLPAQPIGATSNATAEEVSGASTGEPTGPSPTPPRTPDGSPTGTVALADEVRVG